MEKIALDNPAIQFINKTGELQGAPVQNSSRKIKDLARVVASEKMRMKMDSEHFTNIFPTKNVPVEYLLCSCRSRSYQKSSKLFPKCFWFAQFQR